MKTLAKIIAFLIAAPIVLLVGAFVVGTLYQNWFTYAHHFRMTVEVETPEGVKSGSSVLKASYAEAPEWVAGLQQGRLNSSLSGEAVFVDLGGGKNVVALIAQGQKAELWMSPDLAARAIRGDKQLDVGWFRDAPIWSGSADLSPPMMPTFATFGDVTKPETAKVIDPTQLGSTLGPGIRLKRVWVEFVVGPRTEKIESIFPWLQDKKNTSYPDWLRFDDNVRSVLGNLKQGR
jgi:hypothetical protein